MSTSTGDHGDDWPFREAFWVLFVRKLSIRFGGRQDSCKDCSL